MIRVGGKHEGYAWGKSLENKVAHISGEQSPLTNYNRRSCARNQFQKQFGNSRHAQFAGRAI
jgi:hypothetical protein